MLLLPCPWCGPRDEVEFGYGGEAHRTRPANPDVVDDAAWGEFLFARANPKGPHRERWVHRDGCRRWFNVERSTVTHEVLGSYPPGAAPGAPPEAAAATAEPDAPVAPAPAAASAP